MQKGYARVLRAAPAMLWGGRNLVVDTQVGPMCLPVDEPSATPLLLWGYLRHEERETRLIRALARTCRVLFDIGAHSGWYARLMSSAHADNVVHAFEPSSVMFPYLRVNAVNAGGIFSYQMAVADEAKRVSFYCAENAYLSSMVRPVGRRIEVDAVSLDDFCQRREIAIVDFIKCDCEGAELAVLRGARHLRQSTHPPIWMIEVDDQFVAEAGHSVDQLIAEIRRDESVRMFTQDAGGRPVQIESMAERIGGINVFLVPEQRVTQFHEAAVAVGP